jgi:hypothetical protein
MSRQNWKRRRMCFIICSRISIFSFKYSWMHFLCNLKTEDLDYCCKNNLSLCVKKIGKINSLSEWCVSLWTYKTRYILGGREIKLRWNGRPIKMTIEGLFCSPWLASQLSSILASPQEHRQLNQKQTGSRQGSLLGTQVSAAGHPVMNC